jgi:peroxiredoxin
MVATHEPVPGFELPGTRGEDIDTYRLSDHTEEGAAVLVFSPFNFSPVCASVPCDRRDAEFLTVTDNVDVFGISLDSCYAHKRFIREYDLPFPLVSDTTGPVTKQYGLTYDEWEYHQGVPQRALITVDDSQRVRYKWHTADAYQSPSLDELHQTAESLAETAT